MKRLRIFLGGLGTALLSACTEGYQQSLPSLIPHSAAAGTVERASDVRSETSLQFQDLIVERMLPRPEAYILQLRLDLEANGPGPVTIRANGSALRGDRGPLAMANPSSRSFTASTDSPTALVVGTPGGQAATNAQVMLPYEWVRRGGAELTLTLTASGPRGEILDVVTREIHVPPPPPPDF